MIHFSMLEPMCHISCDYTLYLYLKPSFWGREGKRVKLFFLVDFVATPCAQQNSITQNAPKRRSSRCEFKLRWDRRPRLQTRHQLLTVRARGQGTHER